MRRLVLLATACGAAIIAGCGGGSTSSTPPPPTGGFSASSLKGQYAFSMSGSDLNNNFITRVGSFTADGNGNITAALEDVINAGITGGGRTAFTGGTYTVQANGKGTLTLIQNSTSGLGLSITLTSTSAGLMVQTDETATSSGSFNLQKTGSFSAAGINNNYVFSVSGVEGSQGAPLAVMGQFNTDGAGTVQSGVIDINDGVLAGPTPPAAIPTGGSYGTDSGNPNDLANFGRGAISFDGFTFVFYIVDSTHLLFLEEDGTNVTSGDALQQSGTIPTQNANFTPGGFAFLVAGTSVLGTRGADARAGSFMTDGSGNLGKVFLNENNDGSIVSVANSGLSQTTYAIDTSAVAQGRGRGTFTFTSSSLGTFNFIFYLNASTQAVIQDQSKGLISTGSMLGQSGTFSNSSLAGNYAFNWSGLVRPSSGNVGLGEDFVGQYAQSSSGGISGAVDFFEAGTTSNHPLFINSAVSGSLSLNGDGTGSNDYKVTISSSGVSPNTFNFKAYIGGTNTVFLVGVDSNQLIVGNAIPQTQ